MSREENEDFWNTFSTRHRDIMKEHEKASRWIVGLGMFGLLMVLTLLGLLGWLIVWTVQQFTS